MKTLLVLSLLLPISTQANSGRTADGCSYKIINGQYLTSCEKKKAPKVDDAQSLPATPAPVESYGSVPVRNNPQASQASVAPVASVALLSPPPPAAAAPIPALMDSAIEEAPKARHSSKAAIERDLYLEAKERRDEEHLDTLLDKVYVGAGAGATMISAGSGAAGLGLGVTVGTLLDEYFGAELRYSYTQQDINLGLSQRDGYAPAGPLPFYDSALTSHLITLEAEAYLASALRPFRPYLGAGLGFKSSTLSENAGPYNAALVSPDSLNQMSLGGIGSAGAKIRVSKDVGLDFAFRYFLPFARQTARLGDPSVNPYALAGADSRLLPSDAVLTGSSQYQLSGGLQYAF